VVLAILLYAGWMMGARPEASQTISTARLALGLTGLAGTLVIALVVLGRQYLLLQENLRLRAELAHQAITDALTGLVNRRRCDELLALELARAERYRRALSVLRLDVNDFKRYNDRHGHAKGDMLLRILAGLLREQLRASDTVARYGGDEFIIILPETNAYRAEAVADKLHAAVRAAFGPDDGVSLSIGCAAFEPGQSADALLALADEAMRLAKPAATRATSVAGP